MSTEQIIAALDAEITKLQQARQLLSGYADPTAPMKRAPGRPKKEVTGANSGKRNLSQEARLRIAAAQKKRWAAAKKSN